MHQSEDPGLAAALQRIQMRKPTQEDINMLNALVGVPLNAPTTIPIVVRRHKLRNAINTDKLRETSELRSDHSLSCYHPRPTQNVTVGSIQSQRRY